VRWTEATATEAAAAAVEVAVEVAVAVAAAAVRGEAIADSSVLGAWSAF
jgi:hypothetical protein